ncbi:MAG TPA: histidinol-phosphatase [Chloroflexota bacterium]|nr:histidinol-phosphatase [Chloroflexota bacterium]
MSDAGGAPIPLSSLHTHSRYCDGQGEIRDYIAAAIENGLAAFGASGHAPLPFPCPYAMSLEALKIYRADVRDQQKINEARFPVFLGLELDYLPGLHDFYANEFFGPGLDYVVASVHYVGGTNESAWVYDHSAESFAAEVNHRYHGDVRPVLVDYFSRVQSLVRESVAWDLPVIVGHLDRVAIWNRDNRWFDPLASWYLELVEHTLDTIAGTGRVLEINTSGWNKAAEICNPSPDILARAVRKKIPIIISADAHYPKNVDQHYGRALDVLNVIGCDSIVSPSRTGWVIAPLPTRRM